MIAAWRFVREHYIVLPVGALTAIAWSNIAPDSYFRISQALALSVNGIGMALVFAYVAQEIIEAMLPGGTLHRWRHTAAAVVVGVGGTLGAVLVYLAYIASGDEEVLAQGWPIACGVDVLLCLAIARGVFRGGVAVSFVVLIAIVCDVIGLLVISRRYPVAEVNPAAALLIAIGIGVSLVLRRTAVRSVWPHLLVSGPLLWLGCYWTGLHTALALLPIVPFFPHSARTLDSIGGADPKPHRPNHFERVFEYPVQVIAFLFGLVNAGVLLRGFGTGTWAVMTASLVGRPVGIVAGAGVVVATGLGLPPRISWREMIVMALTLSPSFAFGLFLAAGVFPDGPLLIETKMGAMGAAIGGALALSAARLLRAGRFSDLTSPRHALHSHETGGPA